MLGVLVLPLDFLKFWFWQAPAALVAYFSSLNTAFLQAFSLPLCLRTYFRPWKNEYREKFVLMAILIGMMIKSALIVVDSLLFLLLLVLELVIVMLFIIWPILAISLLFYS